MVRSELLEKLVHAHPHLPRHVVELALEAILNEITARLAQGHRVELRRFGNFTCRVREARMGRNPRTGEPVFMETRQILGVDLHVTFDLQDPGPFGNQGCMSFTPIGLKLFECHVWSATQCEYELDHDVKAVSSSASLFQLP